MNGLKTFGGSQDSSHEEGLEREKDETHRQGTRAVSAGGPVPRASAPGLTEIVARLQQFEHSLVQQAVIDRERVKGVQRALINGAYSIDAERIAGKMIAFERLLGDEE